MGFAFKNGSDLRVKCFDLKKKEWTNRTVNLSAKIILLKNVKKTHHTNIKSSFKIKDFPFIGKEYKSLRHTIKKVKKRRMTCTEFVCQLSK